MLSSKAGYCSRLFIPSHRLLRATGSRAQSPGRTYASTSHSSQSPVYYSPLKPTSSIIFESTGNARLASTVSIDTKDFAANDEERPSEVPPPPAGKNPIPDFNDAKAAFESKSTGQLVNATVAFGLCQVPILVRNSEPLLKFGRRIFGDTITNAGLKATLFGHFCAGEDEHDIQPTIRALEKAGIGSILDFAAEDDLEGNDEPVDEVVDEITIEKTPKVRVYDYESEAKCDRHVETFKKCIKDVSTLQSDGYAAVKVTALGNPKLLERMSRAVVEAQNLFAKFDANGDGFIGRDEFEHGFQLFFKDEETKLKEMVEQLNPEDGMVDYITWSLLLAPHDLTAITAGCREVGPLAMAAPTEEEVELIEKMFERGHALAKEAAACGTRLLIDAEQARFQPAIDNLVLELQRTYNAKDTSDIPIIYNTYQCYLKDVPDRLRTDVERSERFDYHFGSKLVRGAYMESERALAESLGYPSPIHDTIQETHNCYNDSVKFLLNHAVQSDKQVELMLASHNQESIEKAIEVMNDLGIDRKDPTICFAQLYGMQDILTFNLGRHGYRAYKYVPYGEVKMVMPYLIRRANENSSIASGAGKELKMLVGELSRRLTGRK